MTMPFPAKRRLATGHFAIDNGDQAPLLDSCPCCGKELTEPAADKVLLMIGRGELSFGQCLELVALRKAARLPA